MKNLRDEQYIFELSQLPGPIALKKPNTFQMKNGNLHIQLQKKKTGDWKDFIDPSLLAAKSSSFDAKSNLSDISDGFFDDVDDDELRSEMDKLIFEALQS